MLPKTASAQDAAWQGVFSGSRVSVVSVNPDQKMEVAAVVDGHLKITRDDGLFWTDAPLPGIGTAIVFDPTRPDDIYAGTQRGVFVSHDDGHSWSSFGSPQSIVLNVVGLAVTPSSIFAMENAGAGTASTLFRFDRSGGATTSPIPTATGSKLAYDDVSGWLYAGSFEGVYRSKDNGLSWEFAAGLDQVGKNTQALIAHNGTLVQAGLNGVYSSTSGTQWTSVAGWNNVPELYAFHSFPSGIAINHGNIFFGISGQNYNIFGVKEVSGGRIVDLNLDQYPLVMDSSSGQLWVGTQNGLWGRGGLVQSEASIKRPVVVVPGILGSWQLPGGKWVLDPITHAYDPLLNMLRAAGYVDDKTLFSFPYQWRQDNNISAAQLDAKLAEIRETCGCTQVDIIAHSMGGLVARAYIEGDDYHNDVANLIELGTPNAGSVEAYSLWEAGVSESPDMIVQIGMHVFNLEAFENHYQTITSYLRSKVATVQQLLPVYSYISGRSYPEAYPRNTFLEALNHTDELSKLFNRTHLMVVGTESQRTLTGISAGPVKPSELNWPDGEITDNQYGSGDDTVPFTSLTSIAPANLLVNVGHGDLPKQPSSSMLNYLLGDNVTLQFNQPAHSRFLFAYVMSPVRLEVVDDEGNVESSASNQIDGAFYSDPSTGAQFVSIPDPSDLYHIKLEGTDAGTYHVGVSIIDNDSAKDSNTQLSGETQIGQVDEFEFDNGALQQTASIKPPSDQTQDPLVSIPSSNENLKLSTSSSNGLQASPSLQYQNEIASLTGSSRVTSESLATAEVLNDFKATTVERSARPKNKVVMEILLTLGILLSSLWLFKRVTQH